MFGAWMFALAHEVARNVDDSAVLGGSMKTKYNNRKVEYDGHNFDSIDECKYYQYLLTQKEKGLVTEIELQPRIVLIPAVITITGEKQRAIPYTPDFYVVYTTGYAEYVDVKGFSSQQGELRRKLYNFLIAKKHLPPVYLRWVSASKKWGGESGFLDYDDLMRKRNDAKKKVRDDDN